MANPLVDERDHTFILYEMLDVEKLCDVPRFEDHSKDVFEMIRDMAYKFSVNEMFPTYTECDKEGVTFEDGEVKVPEAFVRLFAGLTEQGWLSISEDYEVGGQQVPNSVALAGLESMFAANAAFMLLAISGTGAARLIESFGTEEQKRKYMDGLFEGRFGGTMALTEPQAGSDVGALSTTAKKNPDGTYSIKGTKIFITNGDHQVTETIVHPTLARIEGDPPGTKGISIFIVPKHRINDDGSLGELNDITVGTVEHKLGIKSSPTCLLNYGENDNCIGELLGEERKGMRIMFQMMNEARIEVGLQAVAHASAAYRHSLEYARERQQGASLENFKDPTAPRTPIINHPDVRRMLLTQKAYVEAMRALLFYSSYCVDMMHSTDEEEAEKWSDRLELLTPICKAYCSDLGFRMTELAIQVYGGYGYCQEYPVEQMMRDCKITSIYEGANGIQAMDLVGRKLGMKGGKVLMGFIQEIGQLAGRLGGHDRLGDLAKVLADANGALGGVCMHLQQAFMGGDLTAPLINAYPLLDLFGDVTMGWLLLWQAEIADGKLQELYEEKGASDDEAKSKLAEDEPDVAFYQGKVGSAQFFLRRILATASAKAEAIKSGDKSVIDLPDAAFG